MPILAGLVLLIQVSFVFHALKSGRPHWWVFIIMGFPVMGCVIYYFIEIFPGSHEHRTARRTAHKLVKALQPDADLKKRAEELESCGSVDNKLALARECSAHQMHAEAVSLYESCLHGTFSHDANILFSLAQAAVEGGYWDKAAIAIARLKTDTPMARSQELCLLEARLLEERGDIDAALALYRELVPIFIGLEARYRYGALLLRLGQHEAANQIFNDILKKAKRLAPQIEDEEQWVTAARRAIANA